MHAFLCGSWASCLVSLCHEITWHSIRIQLALVRNVIRWLSCVFVGAARRATASACVCVCVWTHRPSERQLIFRCLWMRSVMLSDIWQLAGRCASLYVVGVWCCRRLVRACQYSRPTAALQSDCTPVWLHGVCRCECPSQCHVAVLLVNVPVSTTSLLPSCSSAPPRPMLRGLMFCCCALCWHADDTAAPRQKVWTELVKLNQTFRQLHPSVTVYREEGVKTQKVRNLAEIFDRSRLWDALLSQRSNIDVTYRISMF